MIPYHLLPHLNAFLNFSSAIWLATGFYFIRRKNKSAHRVCMLAALWTTAAFLISYLTYHFHVGSIRFRHQGWVRPLYFTILTSHTILAVTLVPLALVTLNRALKERFDKHRKIAHVTLPIWFYVSVTGVIVYWMLYHFRAA